MTDILERIRSFEKTKDFFIGIDSDGCVFDSMGVKHKECFCPAFINVMNLQGVSDAAREVWEFVNLFSKTRGINRFKALILSLDFLREHPEVKKRGVEVPRMDALREWTERESALGMSGLLREIEEHPHPDLLQARDWSEEVNLAVGRIVRNLAPFPAVPDALKQMVRHADTMVVSQTPVANIEHEWKENGIHDYVQTIAGQEMGSKAFHLKTAAYERYEPSSILMIGDAPGDYSAAQEIGALFYPIIPGGEETAWRRFADEALPAFLDGTYRGEYEQSLLDDFHRSLPSTPPWNNT